MGVLWTHVDQYPIESATSCVYCFPIDQPHGRFQFGCLPLWFTHQQISAVVTGADLVSGFPRSVSYLRDPVSMM